MLFIEYGYKILKRINNIFAVVESRTIDKESNVDRKISLNSNHLNRDFIYTQNRESRRMINYSRIN